MCINSTSHANLLDLLVRGHIKKTESDFRAIMLGDAWTYGLKDFILVYTQ